MVIALRTVDSQYLIQLMSHPGSPGGQWSPAGPDLAVSDRVIAVDVIIDDDGAPVVVYADSIGNLHGAKYLE